MLKKLCKYANITGIAVIGTVRGSSEDVCIKCDIDKIYSDNQIHERVPNRDFCNLNMVETEARYFEDTVRILQKDRQFRANNMIIHLSDTSGGISVFAKFISDGIVVGLCGGLVCVDEFEESESKFFIGKIHMELDKLDDELEQVKWLIESIEFAEVLYDIRNSGGLVVQE